ncbi:MAG TPA: molecular chaperone, partial [Pseudomonadaceae bacterium]|nr:molecular chaperone [Pseudomonadaceae bacterium]
LVASPPMVEIAPGERQMVRVVRLDTSAQAVEQAFRVLIDELPQAPDEEATQGLSFLLQYSVPVFVAPVGSDPQAPPAPQLSATLLDGTPDGAPGGVALSVHNSGIQRARLSNLVLEESSGERSMLDAGLVGYVLAGQQMAWPLALPTQPLLTTGQLKARINNDIEEHTLLAVAAP